MLKVNKETDNKSTANFVVLFLITDAEAPVISDTPSTMNVNTDAALATATVFWIPPTVSDNSGEAVILTSDYRPGDNFTIGNTTVTYRAVDVYNNTALYSFDVVVTGNLYWIISTH